MYVRNLIPGAMTLTTTLAFAARVPTSLNNYWWFPHKHMHSPSQSFRFGLTVFHFDIFQSLLSVIGALVAVMYVRSNLKNVHHRKIKNHQNHAMQDTSARHGSLRLQYYLRHLIKISSDPSKAPKEQADTMMPEGWTGLNVIPPNRSGLVVSKKSTTIPGIERSRQLP
jgi:hypothetical protein